MGFVNTDIYCKKTPAYLLPIADVLIM